MTANTEIDVNVLTVDVALTQLLEGDSSRVSVEVLRELADMILAHRARDSERVLEGAKFLVELLEDVLADSEFPEDYRAAGWPDDQLYVQPEEQEEAA